ncbi:MAG: hypothetical protein JOY95_13470 [Silvibacterium sp.]|nr:hypothetical protein [Silvibacterium sp.]
MKKLDQPPTTTATTRQTRKTKYDELISILANNLNIWFELGEEDIPSPTIETRRVRVHQIARQRGLRIATRRHEDHLYIVCTAAPAKTLVKSRVPLPEEAEIDWIRDVDWDLEPGSELQHSTLLYNKENDVARYLKALAMIRNGTWTHICDCRSRPCQLPNLPRRGAQ